MSTDARRMKLGEILLARRVVSEEQLQIAMVEQEKLGLKLGQTLLELGYLDEDTLLDATAAQLSVPVVDLRAVTPPADLVRLLPETYARRFRAVVVEDRDTELVVGMVDPSDVAAYDELSRVLKRRLCLALVRESDLISVVDRTYRKHEEISSIAEELDEELGENAFDIERMAQEGVGGETPVMRLLQSLFEDAVRAKASDIHIEPDETVLRIRQRVDGVLNEQVIDEMRVASALVVRLKLMASLDISEKRLPQDGRFNVRVEGRSIDVRLSTMPVQFGESVVMRLLDQAQGHQRLDRLGIPSRMLARLRVLIRRPHGLIVVTGPTGSGKTTTLYGALGELNEPGKKIISIEDPVEYRLPRVNQVNVNPKIDLSFARVLRASLRQDPDIVMVGELRDVETVEMALRASMTGHLVLTTMHTNDAVSTGVRLTEMGAPGYLIASALRAVIAQRLVRINCQHCLGPQPLEDSHTGLASLLGDQRLQETRFQRGRGCERCNGTGYRGRTGVYELLEVNAEMAEALRSGDAALFARAAALGRDFRPLVESVVGYASKGITSIDEVLRIAGEVEPVR